MKQIPIIRGKVNYTEGTGRYLVYGYFTSMQGQARNSIARFTSTGSLESFNPQVNGEVRTVILLNNDQILIGGQFSAGTYPNTYYNLARLNADGSVDTYFTRLLDSFGAVNSIGVQSTGKIVVGGLLHSDWRPYHLLSFAVQGRRLVRHSLPQAQRSRRLCQQVGGYPLRLCRLCQALRHHAQSFRPYGL